MNGERSRWGALGKGAILIAAICFIYFPALRGDWLWDDDLYITHNAALRTVRGLEAIWLAPAGVNYFPVTFSVQWLQWHLWQDRTLGYHLTNLALHGAASLLVWRLLRRLGLRHAWFGGLLFAVHPVCVESVAWISELKNTLALPPLLLSVLAYMNWEESGGPGREKAAAGSYGLALGGFVLAMLCKSTAAMFPLLLLLYGWWKRGRLDRRALVSVGPFLAVSLGLGLATLWFEHHRAMATGAGPGWPLGARTAVAGMSAFFYLGKGLFPGELLANYPRWRLDHLTLVSWLPGLGLVLLLIGLGRMRRNESRAVLLGLGWFWGNLLPVSGLVRMSYQDISWVADHFAYLSLVGLAGLGAAAWDAGEEWIGAEPPGPARRGTGILVLLGAVAVPLAWMAESHAYARVFRGPLPLWEHTLAGNPNSWAARDNRGAALVAQGRLAEGIAEFKREVDVRPDGPKGHYNLGTALEGSGDLAGALRQYRMALALQPDYGDALDNFGEALGRAGRYTEAVSVLEKAIRLSPDNPNAQVNLGLALAAEHDGPGAIAHYHMALRQQPDNAEAWNNLGIALAEGGDRPGAIRAYREAVRLRPTFVAAEENLGDALRLQGDRGAAQAHYAAAVRLDPGSVRGQLGLAIMLAGAGDLPRAVARYQAVLRERPDLAEVHNQLGLLLARLHRLAEASAELQASLRLKPDSAEAHLNFGNVLYLQGQIPQAATEYRATLRLRPGDGGAAQNLRAAEQALRAAAARP